MAALQALLFFISGVLKDVFGIEAAILNFFLIIIIKNNYNEFRKLIDVLFRENIEKLYYFCLSI